MYFNLIQFQLYYISDNLINYVRIYILEKEQLCHYLNLFSSSALLYIVSLKYI